MSEPLLKKILNKLKNKVDKVEGKELSTNDFTNEYKNKIDSNATEISNISNNMPSSIMSEITTYSSNFSTVDVKRYFKYGNVVVVDFRAQISSDIPNNTTILTLPYSSMWGFTIMAGIGGRYDIANPVWMYFDGQNLKIGNSATSAQDKWLHIHFTYICS